MKVELNAYEVLKVIRTRTEEIEWLCERNKKEDAIKVSELLCELAKNFHDTLVRIYIRDGRR